MASDRYSNPFSPIPSAGVSLTVTGTTARAALVLSSDTLERGTISVRVTVTGTDNVWIAFGNSSVEAVSDGTDTYMLTGTTEVFTLPGSKDTYTHIAAIADGTSASLEASVGHGI